MPWIPLLILGQIYFFGKSNEFSKKAVDVRRAMSRAETADAALRAEKEEHKESKRSYYESINASLQYILTQEKTGFDASCRVTIYREADRSGVDKLKNIFRHAPQYRYDSIGRIFVPKGEGIVGMAWTMTGVKSFSSASEFGSTEYLSEMEAALGPSGLPVPTADLRMPAQQIIAKAIDDHDQTTRVGVIVYESTQSDQLDEGQIGQLLDEEVLNISRFVKHLARLDSDFAPAGGE